MQILLFVGFIAIVGIVWFLSQKPSNNADHSSVDVSIRESTLNDDQVIKLIGKFESSTFTQNEITFIMLTIDIAKLADEWLQEKASFEHTMKIGTMFTLFPISALQTWRKQGTLSEKFYKYIGEITYYFKIENVLETRNVILDYLNDNEASPYGFYDLIEKIQARLVLRKALLNIESNINTNYASSTSFCINFAINLMHYIIGQTNEKLKSTDSNSESDRTTINGLFLFVFTSHLTKLLGLNFESVSSATACIFLGKETKKHISSIISSYNAAQTKSSFAYVLGSHFAEWINSPSDKTLGKLLELYTLFIKNAQVVDS